jgi:hypothetical protein
MLKAALLAAALAALTLPALAADAPSAKGTWRWVKAQSQTLTPDLTDQVMDYSRDDADGFAFRHTATGRDGKPVVTDFEGLYDGKPHPLGGMTMSYSRLPGAWLVQYEGAGGLAGREVVSVTRDRMVFTGSAVAPDGKVMPYIDVWERVK